MFLRETGLWGDRPVGRQASWETGQWETDQWGGTPVRSRASGEIGHWADRLVGIEAFPECEGGLLRVPSSGW